MSLLKKIILYAVLVISSIILMFPIVYAFLISFLSGAELLQGKWWPSDWSLRNYIVAFEKV
ncbi:MAG: carbohydrate ABC transporter permease, partial [Anoxybacillus ayderensis]|nr:carbohydrate ABC transporter permease [Anoxybacillus ayderensis]